MRSAEIRDSVGIDKLDAGSRGEIRDLAAGSNSRLRPLRHALRSREQQIPHPYQVVSRRGKGEHPSDSVAASMACLA